MEQLKQLSLLARRLNAERVGWFGAGLSAAALGMVGYQFVLASLFAGPLPSAAAMPPNLGGLPGLQPTPTSPRTATPSRTPTATRTPSPTPTVSPTRTSSPTRTPMPTRTPSATPTPGVDPAGIVATVTQANPAVLVGAVATFAAKTSDALRALEVTPVPR